MISNIVERENSILKWFSHTVCSQLWPKEKHEKAIKIDDKLSSLIGRKKNSRDMFINYVSCVERWQQNKGVHIKWENSATLQNFVDFLYWVGTKIVDFRTLCDKKTLVRNSAVAQLISGRLEWIYRGHVRMLMQMLNAKSKNCARNERMSKFKVSFVWQKICSVRP